jgi:hypothetical protein
LCRPSISGQKTVDRWLSPKGAPFASVSVTQAETAHQPVDRLGIRGNCVESHCPISHRHRPAHLRPACLRHAVQRAGLRPPHCARDRVDDVAPRWSGDAALCAWCAPPIDFTRLLPALLDCTVASHSPPSIRFCTRHFRGHVRQTSSLRTIKGLPAKTNSLLSGGFPAGPRRRLFPCYLAINC